MKLSILFFLVITLANYSQERDVTYKNGVFNNNLENFALLKIGSKYNGENAKKINGNYYVSEKWSKCLIAGTDGKVYNFDECNYNIFDKRMELSFNNEIILLKDSAIEKIKIGTKTFKPFKSNSSFENKYYQDLYTDDKVSLIKLYYLKKKSVPSNTSLGLFEHTVEIKSKNYFIINNEVIKVPKSKSKILKLLGKESDKNKYKELNIKNDADLIQIVKN